jgi:parallel beta-helix repeat protein
MKSLKTIKLLGLGLALVLWTMAGVSSGEMGLAQPACDLWVEPGESIQEKIDDASPGTVICLEEGTWQENLKIEKSLTLRGQGKELSIIKGKEEGYPVLHITSDSEIEVVIESLTITEAFGRCAVEDPQWICAHGIELRGKARLILTNSQISGNEGSLGVYSISMGDSSQATISGSQISGNRGGIHMRGSSQATISGSQISGNGGDGIWMWGSPQATLTSSKISGNELDGIWMYDSSQAEIKDSIIEGNGTREKCKEADWICNGIEVSKEAHVELWDTTIRNNTDWGIAAVLRKCGYDYNLFRGTVLWRDRGNSIYGNGAGDVCLP